jgi:hypothetical protein
MTRFITQIGQSNAILAFIVILGVIVGFLNYYNSEPALITNDIALQPQRDSLESLANFTIDFSILEDPRYKALEIFGENPVDPGITGERRNPFAPI